jgi:two-component system, OmpR family, alkaline phosphatase synthesis response regulator PhoP
MSKKKIFVIDDERDIQEILRINLSAEGYEVSTYGSAEETRRALEKGNPDLFILDIMLGGTDGYDFCKELKSNRETKQIPIIFLSAKSEEIDKVLGLELGADDYMTKPFGLKELKSRVKVVLRRSCFCEEKDFTRIAYSGIELFPDQYRVTVDGKDTTLTKTEFLILALFLKSPGKIFTRDNIIDSIKGDNVYVIDRTIDVHIMNLRRKLEPYKDIIKTFPGVGYGLKD